MSAPRPTTGDTFDGVRWDYRPDDDWVSPLVSVERYFSGFPWDGAEPAPRDPSVTATPGR